MGKNTKYPSFANGAVSINGENVATTTKKGNTVTSNYNMSDAEKSIYDYAQNSYLQSMKDLNVFDDDTQKNLQAQVDAYKNKGLELIDNTYTPIINNLKNDIASRFGNFDNSVFLDNLNSIENNRASAINSFTQDVLANQSNLVDAELNRRYNYLDMLNGTQNQVQSNILSYLASALQNSSVGNSYNQAQYNSNSGGGLDFSNLASTLAQAYIRSKL